MKLRGFCLSAVVACVAAVPQRAETSAQERERVGSWERAMVRASRDYRSGDVDAAMAELNAALRLAESAGSDPRRLELTLDRMGAVYCGAGEYRSAERCYRRALQLMAADDNSDARSAALQGLEAVYTQTREFTKAEHYGRLALEIREKELGPDNADLGAPLQNLAAVYHSERRYAEAESLYTRALRVLEKGGRAGDRAAANVHNNLARLFGDTGNLDRGIQQAKLAVAIWEGVAGPQDPQLAMGLTNLAKLYCRARRWPDAEEAIERARRIVASAGAGRGPRLEPILRTYADVMAHTGRKREAKQLLHEADALRAEFDRENLIGYTVDVKARGAN